MTDEEHPSKKRRILGGDDGEGQTTIGFGVPNGTNGKEDGWEDVQEDGDTDPPRPLRPWEVRASDAISLKLVGTQGESDIFHPEFTYPVFGMDEVIYGYRSVNIKLYHSTASLFTYVNVTFGESVSGNTSEPNREPDDVISLLQAKLPPDVTQDYAVFLDRVKRDDTEFVPFGTKFDEYALGEADVTYELYSASFATPGFLEFHRRLQVFLLWYIEGASYLEENDERWEMVLLYERRGPRYAFIGYVTYYPFFYYTPEECNRRRVRISQVLILPPYQHRGHGARLYQHLYKYFLSQPHLVQITVEDPNEAFHNLRDRCDLAYLIRDGANEDLRLPVAADTIKAVGEKYKLSKRQAERCVEMLLLRAIEPRRDRKLYQQFRIHVKRRIFRQNEEAFAQLKMDRAGRIKRLDETYENVEDEYREILGSLRLD
ncbi:histone acetyltransferase type B catalytic subunit [Powellomyces hirtus]|nr:histone acetyltransferase type B catalytic subunit [Powellomyces hirtus]